MDRDEMKRKLVDRVKRHFSKEFTELGLDSFDFESRVDSQLSFSENIYEISKFLPTRSVNIVTPKKRKVDWKKKIQRGIRKDFNNIRWSHPDWSLSFREFFAERMPSIYDGGDNDGSKISLDRWR